MVVINSFKKVGVFGLGISGIATIASLLEGGAEVYIADDDAKALAKAAAQFPQAKVVDFLNWQVETIVLSPGVVLNYPAPHPVVVYARDNGIAITCDIELAMIELKKIRPECQIIGITGSNGKSTAAAATYEIFKKAGKKVSLGGNFGIPILSLDPDSDFYIIELSSFQIDLLKDAQLDCAILINITPNHLERYASYLDYQNSKRKILQLAHHQVVYGDMPTEFTLDGKVTYSLVGNQVFKNKAFLLEVEPIIPMQIYGPSLLSAIIMGDYYHLAPSVIQGAINKFLGLRHRNQKVAEIAGVTFINDSKSTTSEAAAAALGNYSNIYWIAGGVAKCRDVSAIYPNLGRVKKAFLIGKDANIFAQALKERGVDYCLASGVKEATELAFHEAKSTMGVVLLSPACASFDQWLNFEDRGDNFIKFVDKLKDGDYDQGEFK